MLLSNVLLLDLFHYRLIDARCKWSTNVKGLMVDMIIVLSITVYFENLAKLISCPKSNETCTGTRMLIHDQWLLVNSLPLLIDKIVANFYIRIYCMYVCIFRFQRFIWLQKEFFTLIIEVSMYFTCILNSNEMT